MQKLKESSTEHSARPQTVDIMRKAMISCRLHVRVTSLFMQQMYVVVVSFLLLAFLLLLFLFSSMTAHVYVCAVSYTHLRAHET